jgi:hypothetical protein
MAKATTKIVTLEGTTELSNKQLAEAIRRIVFEHLAFSDYKLTQTPRVQAAQAPKASK